MALWSLLTLDMRNNHLTNSRCLFFLPVIMTCLTIVPLHAQVQPVPQVPAEQVRPVAQTLQAIERAKMHRCGLEWNRLKKNNLEGDRTWKEFSAQCLR